MSTVIHTPKQSDENSKASTINTPNSSTEIRRATLQKNLNLFLKWSPVILFSTLGIIIFLLATRDTVETFLSGTYQNEFLLIFLLTLYFPMTYIAYYRKIDQRRVNLINKNAGRLLGYDQKDISDLTANTHSPFTYILFISLTVLLCIIGFSLFFWPPSQGITADASLPGILLSSLGLSININTLQAMRYGFLGAYIFSAFLLYRRYATNDLDPTAYLYCAFTLLTGMAFNYVAFEALSSVATTAKTTQVADGVGAGLIAILAFSMGYFPYLAIRWFNRQAYAVLRVGERRADSKPLSIIDGISDWHETRLRDNGIDDVQNLASAEIVDLLVNTSFPAEQIVAWIDQAILYQYLDDGEIDSFRRGKVAMFTDLLNHMDTGDGKIIDTEPLKELATALQSTPEKLKSLWISIQNGPNTHRIRHYWQEANNLADEARETPPIVRSAEAERASSYVALATQPIPSTEPDSTGAESGTVVTRLPTLPDDYYFLNHTSFLRPEKQVEFRKLTHVERDHYDIRVIVDSYYPSAMENIVQVEYILHNSFPNPRRVNTDAANHFMLKEIANGQFVLKAEVYIKGRTDPIHLQRFITLWVSGPRFPDVPQRAAA